MTLDRQHVMIMAGGTGGHIFPGLAVAHELKEMQVAVSWLGASSGMEASLVPKHGVDFSGINVVSLRGKKLLGKVIAMVSLIRAIVQSIRILRSKQPTCVLGMGGFAAGPGAIAARILRIPIVIHEQNAISGLTNRKLARFSKKLLTGFAGVFDNYAHSEYVGNPVRADIIKLEDETAKTTQRKCNLLVVGGSLGALALNNSVPLALKKVNFDFEIKHQAGEKTYVQTLENYRLAQVDSEVMPFIDDMAVAYKWADIVICRAGALTVAELAAAGKASILVPFPHAVDDHQTANGKQLVNCGAAAMIAQEDLTADVLATTLNSMVENERFIEMGNNARSQFQPESAKRIADICLNVAKQSRKPTVPSAQLC